MKIEDQVCSLESAKRLKELGVEQESHFYWCLCNHYSYPHVQDASNLNKRFGPDNWRDKYPSAFTVGEMGEMLPWDIIISRNIQNQWHITWQANGYSDDDVYSVTSQKSEADCRAIMLIYLIEKGLLNKEKRK